MKRWRRENPHKLAVQLGRRRARKLNAEGDFTVGEFETLCEGHGNLCLRCGRGEVLLTPDHILPLALGGSNLISNIQPLCGACNSWKNVKVVDYRTGGPPHKLEESRSVYAVSLRFNVQPGA